MLGTGHDFHPFSSMGSTGQLRTTNTVIGKSGPFKNRNLLIPMTELHNIYEKPNKEKKKKERREN